MPNKTLATEWLVKAYHDLSSARILYDANHYTDTIGFDLQQAIEKSLKAFLAYENKQIKRTHDLVEIYELVTGHIQLEDSQIDFLDMATNYYAEDRYPAHHLALPQREEIKDVLTFTETLFSMVCHILGIDEHDVRK